MKLYRVTYCVLFLLSLFHFAPAETPLSVISTAYFDFIYPEASADTAACLAEYADGLADEICLLLDTSMKGRIPVYLNPEVRILNAYYTPYPYNRIVLYDTTATDGSLGSFRDAILKVFYHELTHAVSFNIRTPFWQLASEVFGDIVSVNSIVTMPLSFLEGVTVSLESRDGGGRLNDPLTRHFFVQDKIEGKTPSWKDVAGSRDIYPGSAASYLYGGAFSAWLQDTYGMEKYAELWKRGGGFNPFKSLLQARFRQVYGIPLAEAWAVFLSAIPVPPAVQVNDSGPEGVPDGIYSALASGPDVIAFADGNSGSVSFLKPDGFSRRLFDADTTVNRLSFSPDGKLLLVSLARVSGSSVSLEARVFDMAAKRFLPEIHENLRDASFAGSGSLICGIEPFSQTANLVLFDRADGRNRRILLSAGPDRSFHAVYNPVSAGPGRIACIGANGLDRRLLLVDTVTGNLSSPELPAPVGHIRFLQSPAGENDTVLSFGWAGENTLYRYALYCPDTGLLRLQDRDYSGGVFYPVLDSGSGRVAYVASFSGRDSLAYLEPADGEVSLTLPFPDVLPPGRSGGITPRVPASRFYNPLPWFFDGVFVPFPSVLPVETGIGRIAPGFLYITGDPTERFALALHPVFSVDPFFADFTIQPVLRFGGFTVASEISDRLKPALGEFEPYRETSAALSLKRGCIFGPVWKGWNFSLTGKAHGYAPDIAGFDAPYDAPYRASSLSAETAADFSALRKKRIPGFPLFAQTATGMQASGDLYFGRVFPDDENTAVLQGTVSFHVPVVPLVFSVSGAQAEGLSFSPVSVYALARNVRDFEAGVARFIPVFPEYGDTEYEKVNSPRVLSGVAELTLLSLELQRGLPVLPLYANRFIVAGGYRSALFGAGKTGSVYLDSVYTRTTIQASVVIGSLTSVVLSGYAEYAYAIRAETGRVGFGFGYVMEL